MILWTAYTYQHVTRDTFGFALKSTSVTINGEEKAIFKNPKTDPGSIKKSQKGRVAVVRDVVTGDLTYIDGLREGDVIKANLLRPIFKDGKLVVDDTLAAIRERIRQ